MSEQTQVAQFDHSVRVVSLENLGKMCEFLSGMSRRFEIVGTDDEKKTVTVEFSNPDEYGSSNPARVVYPMYWGKDSFATKDNPAIVLDAIRFSEVTYSSYDEETGEQYETVDDEIWQAFEPLKGFPTLWRTPDGQWKTDLQINKEREEAKITLPKIVRIQSGETEYTEETKMKKITFVELLQNFDKANQFKLIGIYNSRRNDALVLFQNVDLSSPRIGESAVLPVGGTGALIASVTVWEEKWIGDLPSQRKHAQSWVPIPLPATGRPAISSDEPLYNADHKCLCCENMFAREDPGSWINVKAKPAREGICSKCFERETSAKLLDIVSGNR